MILVGITGVIGSGKTTVSNQLRNQGFHIIDLDRLAREALESEDATEEIKNTFGEDCIIDGKPSPDKLKELVFGDRERLSALEKIIHPMVIKELNRRADQLKFRGEKTVIVDGPLIFEKGLNKSLDKIVVVSADMQTIKQRLRERGMEQEDIERRIACQIPLSEKERQADYVIYNNKTEKDLEKEIAFLIKRIREWEEKDASQ